MGFEESEGCSMGRAELEIPIRTPSGGVKQTIEYMSQELSKKTRLGMQRRFIGIGLV